MIVNVIINKLKGRNRLERKWKGKETCVNFDAHFRKTSVQYMLLSSTKPPKVFKSASSIYTQPYKPPSVSLEEGAEALPTSNVIVWNTPKEISIQL
jgi:hypothetical protein